MKKRILTILLCGVLLCGMLPVTATAANTSVVPGVDKNMFTLYGRTVWNNTGALRLFWTNSGFAVKVSGATTVSATISATAYGANNAAYLNVYVDGAFEPTATIIVNRAGTYTLAENLPAGDHVIELRKRNEAAYGGTATAAIEQVTTDGTFVAPPAKAARQIEFIGDSITSGFGNLVTDGSGDYTSATVDGTMTYAVLAAKQLGAEAQVLSRSGIGYCRNTVIHGTTDSSFYPYYTKTAALPGVGVGNSMWDFENNPSDVVVINLGTNDNGGTQGGVTISNDFMRQEAVAFLKLVREKNPDAIIIWHCGLMGSNRAVAFEDAVADMNDDGDDKIFFLQQSTFSSVTEGVGTHGHPTVQANINRSDDLAKFIAEKTGWNWDASAMLKAQLQWSAQYNNEESLAGLAPASKTEFADAIADGKALLQTAASNADLVAASERVWRAWSNRRMTADMASDYIVVDNCDDTRGVALGGNGQKGFDYTDCKEGTASLKTSGMNTTVYINHVNSYNITMPANATSWYLECWLYVDNPQNLPGESVLEFSQVVDQIELSWGLRQLGLEAGWNKLQLSLSALPANFETLRSIRLFLVNPTDMVTVKLDYVVLAAGRVAANTETLEVAMNKAEEFLATYHSETLAAALEEAKAAVSQADVDAQVMRLAAAIDKAEEEKEAAQNVTAGDVDGNDKTDSTDARLVLQYAVGKIDDTALNTAVADVDGNGKVDSTDARLILQKAVGKIETFPIEE